MRKSDQVRGPRGGRQANGNIANAAAAAVANKLPNGANLLNFGDPEAFGFPFAAQLDPSKLLEMKNMQLNSLLLGQDPRTAAAALTDPTVAAYLQGNGFHPGLLNFNNFLNMNMPMANYAANNNNNNNFEMLNLLMRFQLEPKPDLTDLNNLLLANNLEETMEKQKLAKAHSLLAGDDGGDANTVRKFLRLLQGGNNNNLSGNKQAADLMNSISELTGEVNLNGQPNGGGAGGATTHPKQLSNSFLNLSKMSSFDSSLRDEKDCLDEKNAKEMMQQQFADFHHLNNSNNNGSSNHSRSNGRSGNDSKADSGEEDESQRDGSSLEDDTVMADGKKVRVRSVLSEETLRILRAQYAINPRPKKQEINRLAGQVNYSARVVQVWFQNMR